MLFMHIKIKFNLNMKEFMTDINNINKKEKEIFEFKSRYEKELHSTEHSFYTLGCMMLLAIFALGTSSVSRDPVCLQKAQADKKILLAKRDNFNSR